MKKKSRGKQKVAYEILFGVNPIAETIRAGRRKIFSITIKTGGQGKGLKSITSLAGQKRIPVEFSDIDKIGKLAGADGHQGVIAQVSLPQYSHIENIVEKAKQKGTQPVIAILDGIMDPRNLGAIVRSADAFGIKAVVIPESKAASYTPVAAKASAGAGERMSICKVKNIAETVRWLRNEGYYCAGMDGDAKDDFELPTGSPIAVVLGSEGVGIRPLVLKRCDRTMKIPMRGGVGSLNVSATSAIVFYLASK